MTRYTTITLLLALTTTLGCANGHPCPIVESDAAVAPEEGCFPEDPCCEADSRLSARGAPCGTGGTDNGCFDLELPTYRIQSCSGASPLCDGPLIEVPRDRAACLEGYICPSDGDLCTFVGTPAPN